MIRQRLEKYSSYIMGQWNSQPARKCVSVYQQAVLPTVCMQSNNVAVRSYTWDGSEVSDDYAILSDQNST
jgi:hypothetical protein